MTTKTTSSFLKEIFTYWYGKNNAKIKQKKVKTIDWKEFKNDIDSKKFGEYVDLGQSVAGRKIKVLELPEMRGKYLWEVGEYLVQTYGADALPGIEAWEAICKGEIDIPKEEGWRFYFLFGSLVRSSGGFWRVPFAGRDGSGWRRSADWLGSSWDSRFRVVVFEK